jgi:uncharacterized protein (DUF3084 family)
LDVVSLGFILLMVVVGGVVAYIADNLGRKLGKKRLTIGKLRPRHTATLITVAAGMLIPLVTVIAVATLSSDVRVWIAEGRRAVAERDKALGERDTARKDVDSLRAEQKTLRDQNSSLLSQIEESKKAAEKLRKDVANLGKERDGLQADLAGIKVILAEAQSDLKAARGDVTRAEAARNEVQLSLNNLRGSYQNLNDNYTQLETSYKQLEALRDEYDAKFLELDSEIERLESERQNLNDQISESRRSLDQSKSDLEREKINLDEARGQIAVAQKQLQDLQAGIMALSEILGDSRTKPLMFSIGQEVARVAVPQGVNEDGARAYLQAVLKRAADIAEQQGAKPLRGPTAAGLVERQDDDRQTVSVEEQMDRLTESIQKEKSEVLLVASSLVNSFQGEFVGLDVRVYRNPVVYRYTEVIAEGRINGNESEISIYNQLVNFLQNDIRNNAIKKGMIPVSGPIQSLGEVSSEEMFRLMREIKGFGRQVRLVSMAETETRAGDPLKLFFRVR